MSFSVEYMDEMAQIIELIDYQEIEKLSALLAELRKRKGRLFFLGAGGGAANCSHAVNDFRKLAEIEAYTPVDNVSELTARTNDEGWPSVFVEWLKISNLKSDDMLFIFSVGGGSLSENISPNLVLAMQYAKEVVGACIGAVVGRDGGYAAKVADACVVIPTVNSQMITPHTESFQAVISHLLVSHPLIKRQITKWEAVK